MNKKSLYQRLKKKDIIRSKQLEEAYFAVDRAHFVSSNNQESAYEDHPLPIAGHQTISAPHMVFMMLDMVQINLGEKVLEVGTGSGYNAALCAHLVGPKGKVVTLEHIKRLAESSKKKLSS